MVISRSPAQKHIIALVLRGLDNRAVRDDLRRRRLVPLTGRQLDRLRREFVPPEPFLPHTTDHAPSVAFLQRLGIEPLFRRSPHVRHALAMTERPRVQEAVETAILMGAPPAMAAAGIARRFGMTVTTEAVDAYREFLFDTSVLDSTELRWVVGKRRKLDPSLLAQDARYVAATLPSSFVSVVLAQLRQGALPRDIDHVRVLRQARGVLACRVAEAALQGGKTAAQSAAQFAGALRAIDDIINNSLDPNVSVVDELQQLQIVQDHTRVPTIAELTGGNVTVDLAPATEEETGSLP